MKATASVVNVTSPIMLGDSGRMLTYLLTASPLIIKDGFIILKANVKFFSMVMLGVTTFTQSQSLKNGT